MKEDRAGSLESDSVGSIDEDSFRVAAVKCQGRESWQRLRTLVVPAE
ncbi:MAG: hypothetical protein GY856_52450 [bacterium]|nr:hypothetical protein [bacterium]